MAWWMLPSQRRARETAGDKAHSVDYTEFKKAPRMIQPGSIHLTGTELERAVQREVLANDVQWELHQMQHLLIELDALHFTVALHTCRSGWACDVAQGDIVIGMTDDCVREFGEVSPATALARAALAAVRQWPA